jgi:hypothetical protein
MMEYTRLGSSGSQGQSDRHANDRRRTPTFSYRASVTSATPSCEAIENGDDVNGDPGTVAFFAPCFHKYADRF